MCRCLLSCSTSSSSKRSRWAGQQVGDVRRTLRDCWQLAPGLQKMDKMSFETDYCLRNSQLNPESGASAEQTACSCCKQRNMPKIFPKDSSILFLSWRKAYPKYKRKVFKSAQVRIIGRASKNVCTSTGCDVKDISIFVWFLYRFWCLWFAAMTPAKTKLFHILHTCNTNMR